LQIGIQYATTGDFVHKGISLKGGSTITITDTSSSIQELQQFLQSRFPQAEMEVRTIGSAGDPIAIAIDSDAQQNEEIEALLAALQEKVDTREVSVEIVGSSLGESFFRQTAKALLVAFILMGIVVFINFRIPVPSLAVIAAAFSDIVVTLAIFNLTGEKLTSAGVAAFLMLVGYSVDTDLLLTNRVLRREGLVMDKIYSSIKTGLTMTLTTLAAVLVALLLVNNEVVKQIMLILFIGLIADMFMTWIQNVAIIRLYLERKGKK
ncbi:MAG: protein translocase subunit SecF, partial [Nanoarchaeota archaeon]